MDVLYYWKNAKADVAAGKVGWFKSSRTKLNELKDGWPENIWLIKTPPGRKGEVQLLGCLRWADRPKVKVPATETASAIYYDPDHAASVWFLDSNTDEAIAEVSHWVRQHFSNAVRANFNGDNGAHALRGGVLADLKRMAAKFDTTPFRDSDE